MLVDTLSAIPARLRPLVPRLAEGKNNGELADALSIEKHSIENYVSELKAVLEARDRIALVDACRALMRSGIEEITPLP